MTDKYVNSTGTYTNDPAYRWMAEHVDETLGSPTQFSAPLITRDAKIAASHLASKEMEQAANGVLNALEKSARTYRAIGGDVERLEPVRVFLPEDGSLVLEWINPDFRIGFNIEPQVAESGWYIVTTERFGNAGMHRSLVNTQMDEVATLALNFLTANT
jgi:hypothetical protein